VTYEELLEAANLALRERFGAFLAVRQARRVQRVAEAGWIVTVVAAAEDGDVRIGELEVDEGGRFRTPLAFNQVVRALRRTPTGRPPPATRRAVAANVGDPVIVTEPPPTMRAAELPVDELAGLADDLDGFGPDDERTEAMSVRVLSADAVYERAVTLGDKAALRHARELLPRFLSQPESRGATLFFMADVERRLGDKQLALGYLDAAARELANRFDMPGLERCAEHARELLGDRFAESPIGQLLERNRARLRPLTELFEAPLLRGLSFEVRLKLAGAARKRPLASGEYLVTEGEPSRAVFVVKSGVLGVLLDGDDGQRRLVRCCYPGLVLGESSVLLERPVCSASLRAETASEVWALDAAATKPVLEQNAALRKRFESIKYLHRIDSFFSAHETLGQLDPAVRDDVLACLHAFEPIDKPRVLVKKGEVLNVVCLVARGEVFLFDATEPAPDAQPVAVVGTDALFGMRDALHAIASEHTAIAQAGSLVVLFDAGRLRALADRSPTHVVHTLERAT
jgi:hypothetical protein